MKARVLVPVVLLARRAVLWSRPLGGQGSSSRREVSPGAGPASRSAGPESLTETSPPGEQELGELPPLEDPPKGAVREVAEAPAEPERRWAEEDTRWLEVSWVAPPGTPASERAWIVAHESELSARVLHGLDGPLHALHAGERPGRIEGVLAAVLCEPASPTRLALPPEGSKAWLSIGGGFVYTPEPVAVSPTEQVEPLVLRPVLGSLISGQLLAPSGVAGEDLKETKVELRWSSSQALELGGARAAPLNRETMPDDQGHFELRANPVGRAQTIETESLRLAVTFSEDLKPKPGEHLQLELAMTLGATIHGRTVDGEGKPISGVQIGALGREVFGNPSERLRRTESDENGKFTLIGVTPGKTWLHTRCDGYTDFLSKPFEIVDGEERQHGDVQLDEGRTIAGKILFPDGTPAHGTRLSLGPDLSGNLTGTTMDQRVYAGARNDDVAAEDGTFRIQGIGSGPWIVTGELTVGEDAGPTPGRWSVSEKNVAAPAEELELVLEEPIFVTGTVLDGEGEGMAAFRIRATLAGSQWYMPPSEERSEDFETGDGTFRMKDLRAGSWTFTAVKEGYAPSTEVTAELPLEGSVELVLLKPIRLAGQVVDPEGNPVSGAEVGKELEGTEVIEAMQGRGDWPSTTSDAEGHFVLLGMPPGAGSVVAKKEGFARSEAVSFELNEGEERTELLLELRRGARLTGEVLDKDGKPSGGCVLILQMPTMEERRIMATESDGTFDEQGLTPGMWQVQAFAGIRSLQTDSGETRPQSELLASLKMTTVELVNGETEHVVLGEPPADPVNLSGRVTLAGEPVKNSIISFVPTAGGGMQRLKIQPVKDDGRYEVQLDEPGNYLVTIQTQDVPGRQNSIEMRREIASGDETLDFELPLGRVTGRVRDAKGDPIKEARITLNMEGGLVFGTVFGGQYNETITDENGEYEILYLRPGRYAVAAGGARLGGILGSEDNHGRQVTSVQVTEGQWLNGVDFKLGDSGKISGTVRDATGKLVGEAAVFVRDGDGHLVELFSVTQTNASGRFEYPGLAPGDYTVTARTSTQAAPAGVPVRVRSGETIEVTVTINDGTILVVNLVDKSGADVPARVSVLDSEGREMNGMLGLAEIMARYSDGAGSSVQRVGPLPPGSYKVLAFAEDGRTASRRIKLTGKPERKAKLWLR